MDMDCEIYQHLTQTEHAMERADLLCRADPCIERVAGERVRSLHAAATQAKRDFTLAAGESPLCRRLVELELALVEACEACPDTAGAAPADHGLQSALHDALREVRDLRRQLHGDEPPNDGPAVPGGNGLDRDSPHPAAAHR